MTPQRCREITARYASLRVVLLGDFCLDRYLEIDPAKPETSIETGLPVHNVVNVRAQPGGAGTILNNLSALGVGTILPVGFHGVDGEGFELARAVASRRGVDATPLLETPQRRTFTYCKPLVLEPGRPPRELSRLDTKNWTPTPPEVEDRIIAALQAAARTADAVIVLDQVDIAETGVVTRRVLEAVAGVATTRPELPIIADSRRGLGGFPAVIFKMNAAELATMSGLPVSSDLATVRDAAADLARRNGRPVFVTLAERGMMGALASGDTAWVPALPVRGPIDVVGAGDSVTANLITALAAGASLREALELASLAASIVLHQVGTTGAATPSDLAALASGGN
ncbi:MAG: Bifunctional protein HldE [Verrucomicrobiota bacterium]|nr:PfkB family carbohydrate kinase [Opitutaceae bacterium]